MAINWGPYGAHMRVGISVVQRPATVGQNTTSVAIDLEVWVQMDGSSSQYINNGSIVFTGDWFGSATIPINLGPGQSARVWATTATVPTIVGQGQNKTYGATVSHYHGTSYHGVIWWVAPRPAAPPSKPNTPTAVKVTRNSDTKHTIAWTRQSTYTSVAVQRRTNDGNWANVGTASGNAASWVDTSTKANSKYQYRVAGKNAGGQSGYSGASGAVFTSPAKTGAVTAVRVGNDVRISVAGIPKYAEMVDIEDNGQIIASAIPIAWVPYLQVAPANNVTHRYRARAVVAHWGENPGTVAGPWSGYSNTVALTSPPNAPSKLAPNGSVMAEGNVTLSWAHNPVDSSAQSQYQLRSRIAGVSAWTEKVAVSSDKSTATFGTFDLTPVAAPVEWQVRTKGAHASWSPWSATATLEVIDFPLATVTRPGPVVDHPNVTVSWDWFQAQGKPQSQWRVTIFTADFVELEAHSGSGDTSSVVLRNRYEDGKEYSGFVQVGTGGVWSEFVQFDFRAEFVPPLPATLSAVWDDANGAGVISVGETEQYSGPTITNHFTNPLIQGDGTYTELNRNYHRNPDCVGTIGYGDNSGAGTKMTRNMVSIGDGLAIRGRITEYAGNWAYLLLSTSTAAIDTVPVTPGEWVALQVDVRADIGKAIANIQFRSGTTFVAQSTTPVTIVPTDNYGPPVRLELVLQVPEGADRANFSVGFMTGQPGVKVGSWVMARRSMIAKGATEAQARTRVRDFVSAASGTSDPDMEIVPAGALNNSESIKRVQNVRGVTPTPGVVVAVSTFDGRPAIRLINVSDASDKGFKFARIGVPVGARGGGVFRATRHQRAKLAVTATTLRGILVNQPQVEGLFVNEPGSERLSLDYMPQTSGYNAYLYHGGAGGTADVWYTDIGIYPPGYRGDSFTGDSDGVDTGFGLAGAQWDGTPGNSTSSTKLMPAITHTDLLRSFDDGQTWEPFILDGAVSYIVNDWEARSNGRTMYRVITYSTAGASTYIDITLVADSQAMWLGGGEAFGVVARLPFDPAVSIDVGRARTVHKYEGRTRGVAYASQHLDRVVSASMTVLENDSDNASIEQIEAVAHADSALHLYRDPDGRRIYGAVSSISLSRETGAADGAIWSGSFQIEETDH